MKHKQPFLRRALSIVLSFAVVLPACLSLVGDNGTAQALTSLPYIEKLKAQNTTFNILEIVPAAGQGSIGYYIPSQEPCANWPQVTATKTTPTARKAYVDDLLLKLTQSGILSTTADVAPLFQNSAYSEVYPWQDHTTGYTKLTLDTADTVTATGTFTPATNGEYSQSKDFTLASSGNYVQVINNFSFADATSGQYYYVPTFSPIADKSAVANYTAIYTNTATINNPLAQPADNGYVYEGTTGTSGFSGMEIGESPYYYVTSYTAPSATKPTNVTAEKVYVGVSDAYKSVTAGTGYFNIDPSKLIYTYVGSGGSYNFSYSAGGVSNNIKCDTVYYKGGYTNNNWFLKYVLDWTDSDATAPLVKFKVQSVVGSSATVEQVNNADLIVLSRGFVPNGTATTYSTANDIKSTTDPNTNVLGAIEAVVDNTGGSDTVYNMPVIVDSRLIGSGAPNLSSLATYLKYGKTSTTSFVYKSIFFFAPDATRTSLATNNLNSVYNTADYQVSGSAFYPAYDQIVYENFIRQQEQGASAVFLEKTINLARAIRYIINFAEQRVKGQKSVISVLYLEPTKPSTTQVNTLQTSINGWTGFPKTSINIVPMSTLEFVGKTDDLIENYDLIYIGDNGGFPVSKLDSGYVYENIGSPVTVRSDAVGLTDTEYSATATFTGTDGKTYSVLRNPQTTRYSGDDLSTKKLNDLNNYAVAGRPVIIAGSLTIGTAKPAFGAVTFTANISGEQSGTNALLTANAAATSGELPTSMPTYQWYRNSGIISSATSATYTAISTGTYYCTITYTVDGVPYTATSNTLSLTPTTIYTHTEIDNGSSGSYQTITDYTLTLSRDSNTYTVTVSPAKQNISYQWQGRKGNGSWHDINGVTTENTLTDKNYSQYQCEVIIDGTIGTTSPLDNNATSVSNTVTITASNTFNAIVTPTLNADSVTLTCNDIPDIGVTSFQWYYKNIFGGYSSYLAGSSITVTSGTYYCEATKGDSYANSSDYVISSSTGFSIADNGGGVPKTIPAQPAQPFEISSKVDNCSNMFKFMYANRSLENFMSSTNVDTDTLLRYLNLSKPTINFTSTADATKYPTKYSWDGSNTPSGLTINTDNETYTLRYNFTITNPTDTTPLDTQYYCNLYIDSDSDSRFIEQERIGSIEIRKAPASGETQGVLVDSGSLKAGQEYIVTRTLPSGIDGFLPWKLEVVKITDDSVHTSRVDYTYAKPLTPEVINILQINTGSGVGLPLDTSYTYTLSNYANNQGVMNSAQKIRGLLTSISSDYTINIQTITTTQAHNISSVPINNTIEKDANNNPLAPFTDIKKLIYSYDMVIIGFDDCYSELDEPTSTAIVEYLKDNHPILYSHDTTSMSNVPQVYNSNHIRSNFQITGTYWGYYFNSVLRDPLGLDRYGVTSSVFGLTSKSNPGITSGIVAAGYSGLGTAVTKKATPITPLGTTITNKVLLDEGYSIAYSPGTNSSGNGGTPIGTTQGMTNYMFSGNLVSRAVTQVNKGMITTYPFDVNLASGSTMTILDTHQQYYQANMNPDDVIVWYCLSDGGANYAYNDASSAYYIFSNGNATYSGFGHSLQTIGTAEAELFVNSIIAAYRITAIKPEVKFTDVTGNNVLTTFLIPADDTGVLNATASMDTNRNLYFTVNDSNVGKNKTVTAIVSYGPSGSQVPISVPIYDSQTNLAISSSDNLVSGLAYYVKIDEVWSLLPQTTKDAISEDGITINVTATTHVRSETLTKTESVTLRKLLLFDLG